MIALYIVGSFLIIFFLVIFTIATIRVLKQSRSNVETVKMGEQVIAVITKSNGQKEFIT